PRGSPCHHRVGEDDELSGASDQRNLVLLSGGAQTLVHRLELRIVPRRRRQRRRDHSPSYPLAAAADVTVTVATAAVIVIGRKPDQRGNLLAAEPADLGNTHQDDDRRLHPDAVDAFDQIKPLGKIGVLADLLLQPRKLGLLALLKTLDIPLKVCPRVWVATGLQPGFVAEAILHQLIDKRQERRPRPPTGSTGRLRGLLR